MWIVGVLACGPFRALQGAPAFSGEALAAAWERRELTANRIRLAPVPEVVT